VVDQRTSAPRRHVLTVALEDYFHVGAFNQLIQRGQWYRFERRLEQGTRATLDLLDEHGLKGTFFVLGWVAEHAPEIVREVAERGHEVASKGYYHRGIEGMTPEEFRDDLARAREAIETASRQRVLGYRVADRWFRPEDLWALDVLAEEGYAYDSSIAPLLRRYAAEPWRRTAHLHAAAGRRLWELPIPSASVLGLDVPVGGGNWFRQLPAPFVRRAVARWDATCPSPFVLYFHTWELDPGQPRFETAPLLSRVRQYRNLDRMRGILRHYLTRYRFTGVAEHLGLAGGPAGGPAIAAPGAPRAEAEPAYGEVAFLAPVQMSTPTPTTAVATAAAPRLAVRELTLTLSPPAERVPVTVVVPCYNEELVLPYLANTLESVGAAMSHRYELRYVFVDDRSTDGTWASLQRLFGGRENATLVRHERNRGVAAAIMTGLRAATTEVVCSIDCDCTYDPHELARFIPLLDDGVDLVTASPYHPDGTVRNVPEWRLFLSRGLSGMYRLVLRHKLHTYTSCFRVYRRSAFAGLPLRHSGFLGIAEMLGRLDLGGGRIVECPATLEVRMLGRSKMKIARTIVGHLGLLARLASTRAEA
jgi:polysaccharide deacetylase family protein (PEP-CTERM system associated)